MVKNWHNLLFVQYRTRLLNVIIRIISLVAKLGLTFYMGKYCSLTDLGTYGLVFGTVMILGTVMGIHIDYIVSREIVGQPILVITRILRDEAVFYAINFAFLAIGILLLPLLGLYKGGYDILLYTFIITVLETIATTCHTNMNSMEQQVLANSLFFLRSGLWALIIMGGGIFFPFFRTIDVIMAGWIIGLLLCLAGTVWGWRKLPWKAVRKIPIQWKWITGNVKKSFFLWLGGLSLIVGGYADRLITDGYLGREAVGVITFYGAFTAGILTLLQSGVFAFASPKLIAFYRSGDKVLFWQEVRHMALHAIGFTAAIALVIAIVVPWSGTLIHRTEFSSNALTLWLMLAAIFIRVIGQVFFCILFARSQDSAVWMGDMMFAFPSIGGNLLMLPYFGLPAIGYSSILAAIILMGWRFWHVIRFKEPASPGSAETGDKKDAVHLSLLSESKIDSVNEFS